MIERWQAIFDHPILWLELRRIHRKRWWPGRRFFLFYPVLLGAALGCGVMSMLDDSLGTRLAALVTSVPLVCLVGVASWLLNFALPWIAPTLTATSIARERELGTFDLLRATLLTERSIVLGKLGGCLARLWPGILTLALLAPFQVLWVVAGGSSGLSSVFLLADSMLDPGRPWMWSSLLLAGLAGLLRPWGDLALHATVGLFVSALSRSSGKAIAVSYGAILATRVAFYLLTSLLNIALLALPVALLDTPEAAMNELLMMPALTSLGMVLVEFVGAALLVWAAVWWLKRT
ncbi:MAG TPA: hypothetical protein EYH30_00010 [Anaerolineales bacterium]|nr:hypothetical protein [Anaerolineales bacterium]